MYTILKEELMKILHSADWHLGVKNLKLSSSQQLLVKDEMLMAVQDLFRKASREDYDVILICGDLFHSKNISQKIVSIFLNEVAAFSKPVIYIEGNHDCKFNGFDKIPANFIMLNNENYKFEHLGTNFYCASDQQYQLDENATNILLLHGHIENGSDNDFIDINKYLKMPFDYIALGHVHQFKKYKKQDKIFAYSGSLFSCGFDECGEKGFLNVVLEGKNIISIDFVPFAPRKYLICNCDITNLNNIEIIGKIKDLLHAEGATRKDCIRVVLSGYFTEDCDKSLELIKSHLEDYFYIEIVDDSKLRLDIDKIKNEKLSFKYEFISLVEQSEFAEAEKQKIIEIGLEALKGEGLNI